MPTFVHGKATKVYVNGFDLSTYFNKTDTAKTSDTAETTTFQQDAKTYIPGMGDATMQCEGFLDKTAAASDPVLNTALGADASIVTHLPEGDVSGKTGVAMKAVETAYGPGAAVTEANKLTASFQSQVGGEVVTSLAALASRTGGGTVAGVNYGTASVGSLAVGYLHCTAINGGTAVVKLQDSADNITYADLITFADITTANTAQRVAAAGTARQYTRTTHAVTGGTASFWAGLCLSGEPA